MILQEHDNNIYTKEKTDVEKYLMRIIQRYFETENNYSKASIESIIVESLTRFKRFCKNKGKGFLFSFNRQTGHIVIDLDSFGGERAFQKNTAFNKDFGAEIDTICAGDDPRLSDARPALQHYHDRIEINGLEEILKQIEIPNQMHQHKNQSLLDLLDYTGSAIKVDLAILEQIQNQIPVYQTNAAKISAKLTTLYNQQYGDINSRIAALDSYVDNIAATLMVSMQWVTDARTSINDGANALKDYALRRFARLLTQEQYQALVDLASKVYSLQGTGCFDIRMTIDGIKNITNNGQSFAVYNMVSDTVSLPSVDANCMLKMYFQYQNDSGSTVRVPLPMVFKDTMGNDVIIQGHAHNNTISYQTFVAAQFSGKGLYDEDYNDGRTFILKTVQSPLDYAGAVNKMQANHYLHIDYDPANTKQQDMLQTLAPNGAFYTGAFYLEEEDKCFNVDGSTCKFTDADVDFVTGEYIYYKEGALCGGFSLEAREQLFEIPFPVLEDFYQVPQIYYEVFKKGYSA